jgi:glyceraldehyde-3-phosphate dehydrogenase (NAD(P))
MANGEIKVGIIGYGTIGKRVADAVRVQPDMELVGVTANSFGYKIAAARHRKKINIFLMSDQDQAAFKLAGIEPSGSFEDLLKSVDVVVDCTPKPLGAQHRPLYEKAGVKAIYQGGEKKDVAQISFVSQCKYSESLGKDHIRVVSCNTTGMARTLHAIDKVLGISHAHGVLIRRGSDSNDHKKGPINAIVPSFEQPSHHGPDVRTILPRLEIFTTAYIVPTTLMHVHDLVLDLRNPSYEIETVAEILRAAPRVRVIPKDENVNSTAEVLDYAKDLEFNFRGDMMEICVWENSIGYFKGHGYNRVFVKQAVHQESNVIPESIDAIRAAMGFDLAAMEKLPAEFRQAYQAERQRFEKSRLYLGKDDKCEEINPSRVVTDYTLGLLKSSPSYL